MHFGGDLYSLDVFFFFFGYFVLDVVSRAALASAIRGARSSIN
jgi:hypothetical protein